MDESTYRRVVGSQIEDIAAQVTLEDADARTQVVLAVSPCRSGSTALVRAVAAAGVATACQPLKTLLRWRILGDERRWVLKNEGHATVFIKETLGPYSIQECHFDPLGVLMSHIPASRLNLLVLGRHPHACWRSHKELEGPFADMEVLAASYWATESAYDAAITAGIPVTTVTYEAFRDSEPYVVLGALGRRLSLPLSGPSRPGMSVEMDWPADPPAFSPAGSYDVALGSDRLSYRAEPSGPCPVTSREEMRLDRRGLRGLYERWRQRSNNDLGLVTAATSLHG